MAAYNKFNAFSADLDHKVHNLGTSADVLKVMLSNTTPVATNAVKTDITEIGAGNGYSAGGTATTITASSQSSGTFKLVCSNVVFTATGPATGAIGPFEYAVLYNSTAASGNLIAWWDYGSPVTMGNGDTFTVAFDQTNGVFQLA